MTKQENYVDSFIKKDLNDSLDLFAYQVPFLKKASIEINNFSDSQLKIFFQMIEAFPLKHSLYKKNAFSLLDEDKRQLVVSSNLKVSPKLYSYEQLIGFGFDVSVSDIKFTNPWKHLQDIQFDYRLNKRGLQMDDRSKFSFDANTFASYVLERLDLVQNEVGDIFRYNGQGLHVPLYENVLKSLCRKIINEAGQSIWKRSYELDYMAAIKSEIPYVDIFDNNPMTINFPNGFFDINRMELGEHNPDYHSINQLSYSYCATAECPRFEKFLEDALDGDVERIKLVQEIMGYLWIREVKIQKAFIFLGNGANGKSTLAKTIRSLLGNHNVSSVGLKKLQDRFGLQEFPGKLVNISSENEFAGDFTTENFKLITSGDSLSVEKKNVDSFTTVMYVKLIVLLNRMMDCKDTSDAFIRRLIILPFNKKYIELKQGEKPVEGCSYMDKSLESDLEKELAGIFNFSMAGLKRLIHNDFKLTRSIACDNALEHYQRSQNPVISFIEACVRYKEDSRVPRASIYNSYQLWCKQNGIITTRATSKLYLHDELKNQAARKGKEIIETKVNGTYFFKGIELKVNTEEDVFDGEVPPIR